MDRRTYLKALVAGAVGRGKPMGRDRPDWQRPVDLARQSLGNLSVDLDAQSIGNLTVDVAAQSLSSVGIDIQAQSLGNLQQDQTVQSSESVNFATEFRSGTVADGDSETVTFQPPSGEIWEVQVVNVDIGPTGGTGGHILDVRPENAGIGDLLTVRSSASVGIGIEQGYVDIGGDQEVKPPSNPLQYDVINGFRIDEDDGLTFDYTNLTGADQTGNRLYGVYVRELSVS
jgi:hypothetical protein